MHDQSSKKADEAIRAIIDRSDQMVKHGTGEVPVSDKVKAAVKSLHGERQLSEDQLNRRATI